MKAAKILLNITFILCFFVLLAEADISTVFKENTPGIFKPMRFGDAAWADFRGNGLWDLAVSGIDGSGQNKVYLYRNHGKLIFSVEKDITVAGDEPAGIAWGDYNNSGRIDLLVAGWETTDLYENRGGGAFVKVPVSGLDVTREAKVAWADFNNDGLMDLAIIGYNSSRLYVNNGNGSFSTRDIFSTDVTMALHAIAWGDYNNSGYPDLLITGSPTGIAGQAEIYLFENNGDGTFSSEAEAMVRASTFTAVEFGDVAWGDLNNNGFLDLVIAGRTESGNKLIVYENQGTDGNYNFEKSASLTGIRDASLAFADVNNNGRLDIIAMGAVSELNYKTFVYINEGNFNFAENELDTGMRDGALVLADCTGSRMPDLYLHGSEQVKLYRNKVEGKEAPKAVAADDMHSVYYLDTLYIMWNPPDGITDEYYYNFRIGEEEGLDNLAPARYGSPLFGSYLSKATTNTHQNSRIKNGQVPDMDNFKYIRAVEVSGSNYHWAVQSIDASLGFTWTDADLASGWSENKVFIDTTPPVGYPSKPSIEGKYTYDRDLTFTLDKGSSEDIETRIFGAYVQLQEIEYGGIFNDKDNIIVEKEIWPGRGSSVWGENGTFEYEHKGSYDRSYRIRVKARHGYSMHLPFSVYLTTAPGGFFDYYGGYSNYDTVDLENIHSISVLASSTSVSESKIENDFASWHFNTVSPHYTSAGPNGGWSEWSDPITPVRLLTVENNLITQPGVHTVDIGYFALEDGRATIRVFDIMGNHVVTLLDESVDSGVRKFIQWDGLNRSGKPVASGIYYINIQVPDGEDTSKVAVIK